MYVYLGESIHEAGVGHVNEKVKVAEEISTKDGSLNIGKDEDPPNSASKSKVEGHTRWGNR